MPQPEGPTRTRNSPSLTSRFNLFIAGVVDPGYVRDAFSNTTVAMKIFSFSGQVRARRSCDEGDEPE